MSDDVGEHTGAVHRRDAAMLIRWVLIAAIVVAIVVVAMDNRTKTRVGYAVGETQAPILLVIIASAVGGIVIGWLIRHRPRHRV